MDNKNKQIKAAVIRSNNDLYNKCREQIVKINNKIMDILVVSILIILVILIITSLIDIKILIQKNLYLSTLVFLFILFLSGYNQKSHEFIFSKLRVTMFIITGLSFGVIIGSIANTDTAAVMINVIMLGLSIAFINPLLEIYALNAIAGAVLLYFSYINKSYVLFQIDLINFVSTFLITAITSYLILYLRFELIYEKIELNRLSLLDDLTGINNRKVLYSFLNDNFENKDCIIAILDIDDFKKINDIYGHLAGDKCLSKIGNILKDFSSEFNVTPCRFGGEEFVISSADYDLDVFNNIIETLRKRIADETVNYEDNIISITVSIGISCSNDNPDNYVQLISYADKALYAAKESGKNVVLKYKEIRATS